MALADRTMPFITSKEANKITFFMIIFYTYVLHSTSGKSEYLLSYFDISKRYITSY